MIIELISIRTEGENGKMKTYKIFEPQIIKAIESDLPEIKDDEVLVKVSHIGICGSDVQLYLGSYKGPFNYPIAFGHEWSGKVVKTGKQVRSVREGDQVTGDCSRFCGECAFCREDRNLCKNIEKFGITIDGASAEYLIRKEKYLYRAPDAIDLSLLSLTEPLAVAAHLLGKVERWSGSLQQKKVLILGAGAIGLGTLVLLKHLYNVENVAIFDISNGRISMARELGAQILAADYFKPKAEEESYKAIYEADYDLIIETTGNAEVFSHAFKLIKPLGVLGCLGMITAATIEQKLIVMKGLRIIGSIGGTGDFPRVIDFIHKHSTVVNRLVSHRVPIVQADRAFQISQDKERSVKVVLEF
jgi:L-iditol 2-dehydrogenase